jgi:hypothetical protein
MAVQQPRENKNKSKIKNYKHLIKEKVKSKKKN